MSGKVSDWAYKNRVLIAGLSLAGSFAGVVFSLLDLQTALQEKKRRDDGLPV